MLIGVAIRGVALAALLNTLLATLVHILQEGIRTVIIARVAVILVLRGASFTRVVALKLRQKEAIGQDINFVDLLGICIGEYLEATSSSVV